MLSHLERQLSSRTQDQARQRTLLLLGETVCRSSLTRGDEDLLQDGQRVGKRFAGSSLCHADEVATLHRIGRFGENCSESLVLDGGWLLEAHREEGALERGQKMNVLEAGEEGVCKVEAGRSARQRARLGHSTQSPVALTVERRVIRVCLQDWRHDCALRLAFALDLGSAGYSGLLLWGDGCCTMLCPVDVCGFLLGSSSFVGLLRVCSGEACPFLLFIAVALRRRIGIPFERL